jgi:hypothetical protein
VGVRVLYLTGWLRTGSTLLGNVLGELPEVAHVGELHYLWRNGVLRTGTNSLCGCGKDLLDCPVWAQVLGRVPVPAQQVVAWQRDLLRTRHTRARLAEARGRAAPAPGVAAALDMMAALYRAVAAHAGGGRLIVDGSKFPAEAAALLGRRDLDVRVLHVVRDPRATAQSYRRAKAYIEPRGPAESSGYWLAFNLASDLVGAAAGRYLRIRHEDLAARPRDVIAEVMRFAGLADAPPVDSDGTVRLGGNHTVTGNPDRLTRGTVTIRPDERWRTELPVRAAAVATAVAAPLLRRYGYPLIGLRGARPGLAGAPARDGGD